jgi:hypothetical protein
LNSGTWYNPKLNTVELTFSIISVVLIVALELLIHLDILIEGFQMPTWGWLMLVCPTEGTALATCMIGLTIWCDFIFAAVGLNIVDWYIAWDWGLNTGSSSQEGPAPTWVQPTFPPEEK